MDLTTLVSGHLRYFSLLIGQFNSIELQAPVWRLGKERQLAQQAPTPSQAASGTSSRLPLIDGA